MPSDTVRARVVLPRALLEAIDELAGQRGRSQFVADALRDRLIRARQSAALRDRNGVLDPVDYPEWETPEKTSAWLRSLRATARRSREDRRPPSRGA